MVFVSTFFLSRSIINCKNQPDFNKHKWLVPSYITDFYQLTKLKIQESPDYVRYRNDECKTSVHHTSSNREVLGSGPIFSTSPFPFTHWARYLRLITWWIQVGLLTYNLTVRGGEISFVATTNKKRTKRQIQNWRGERYKMFSFENLGN